MVLRPEQISPFLQELATDRAGRSRFSPFELAEGVDVALSNKRNDDDDGRTLEELLLLAKE